MDSGNVEVSINLTLEKQISSGAAYPVNGILPDSMLENNSGGLRLKKLDFGRIGEAAHSQEIPSPVGSPATWLRSPKNRQQNENLEIAVVDEVHHRDSDYYRSMVGNNQTVDSSFTKEEMRFNSGTIPDLAVQQHLDRFQHSFSRQEDRANTSLGNITARNNLTARSGNNLAEMQMLARRTTSAPFNELEALKNNLVLEMREAGIYSDSNQPTVQEINQTNLAGQSFAIHSAIIQKNTNKQVFNFQNQLAGYENMVQNIRIIEHADEAQTGADGFGGNKLEDLVYQSNLDFLPQQNETRYMAGVSHGNKEEDHHLLTLLESRENPYLALPVLHLNDDSKSPNVSEIRYRSPASVGSGYFKTPQLRTIPSRRDSENDLSEAEYEGKENVPAPPPEIKKSPKPFEAPLTTEAVLKLTSELKVKNFNPYSMAPPEAYHAIDKMANVSMNTLRPTKELWEVLDCVCTFDTEPLPHRPGSGASTHKMLVTLFENGLHAEDSSTSLSALNDRLKNQSSLSVTKSALRNTVLNFSKMDSIAVNTSPTEGENSPQPKYLSEFVPSFMNIDQQTLKPGNEQAAGERSPSVPLDIVVVIDNSPQFESQLPVIKAQLKKSLKLHETEVRLAFVTCGALSGSPGNSPTLAESAPTVASGLKTWVLAQSQNHQKIEATIDEIVVEQQTDLQVGLEAALKLIKCRRKPTERTCVWVFTPAGRVGNKDTCLLANIPNNEAEASVRPTPATNKHFEISPRPAGKVSPSPKSGSPIGELVQLVEHKIPQLFCFGIGQSHDGKSLWDLARNRGGMYFDCSDSGTLSRLGDFLSESLNAVKSVVVNTLEVSISLLPSTPLYPQIALLSSPTLPTAPQTTTTATSPPHQNQNQYQQQTTPVLRLHNLSRGWRHTFTVGMSLTPSSSRLLRECPFVLGAVVMEYREIGGRCVRVEKSVCCWAAPERNGLTGGYNAVGITVAEIAGSGPLEQAESLQNVHTALMRGLELLAKGCFELALEAIASLSLKVREWCQQGAMLLDLARTLTSLERRMIAETKNQGYNTTREKNAIRNHIVQMCDYLERQLLLKKLSLRHSELSVAGSF